MIVHIDAVICQGAATFHLGDSMKHPLRAAIAVITALAVQPVSAAPPDPPGDPPAGPRGITSSQFQGLACLGTGALGSLVAYAYTDALVLTGAVVVNPIAIFAPVVATGFAFGCSIGATAAPGVYWLHTQLQ